MQHNFVLELHIEATLDQQNGISLAPEKMGLTSDTLDNSSNDQHSAIKSKILNSTVKIKKNKKRADLYAITDYILKTEASNLNQNFIEPIISELTNRNLMVNRRTPQGLDSFRRIMSISPEQEEVLRSPVHGKCNHIPPSLSK